MDLGRVPHLVPEALLPVRERVSRVHRRAGAASMAWRVAETRRGNLIYAQFLASDLRSAFRRPSRASRYPPHNLEFRRPETRRP